MIDEAGDEADQAASLVWVEAPPPGWLADVHTGLRRARGTGRVVRQDQRQRAVALAVGALVIGRRVPGADVAVGVDLSQPDQTERGEVLAGLSHGTRAHPEVERSGDRIRHRDRGGHAVHAAVGVAEPDTVEVGDALVPGRRVPKRREQGVPHGLRDRQHRRVPGSSGC